MRQRCRHSLIVFLRERLTRWTPETFPGTQDQISDEDLHRTGIRVTRITCSRRVGSAADFHKQLLFICDYCVHYIYCKIIWGDNTNHHHQHCSTSGERSNRVERAHFLCFNSVQCGFASSTTREKIRDSTKKNKRLVCMTDPLIGPNANKKIRQQMTIGAFLMVLFSSLE